MKLIPKDQYREILKCMPILCVDGIILDENDRPLLLRRDVEPERGKLWFPGGRVFKNELLEDAIVRKVKEEIGVDVSVQQYVGTSQTIFDVGPMGDPVHTVNFTFLLSLNKDQNISIDSNHLEYVWFDGSESVNPEVERMIRSARIVKKEHIEW